MAALPIAETLASRWWLLLLRGVAAIAFGGFAFFAPRASLSALVIVWGTYALVDGVATTMLAAKHARNRHRWGWLLTEGLLGIAAGVISLAWPGMTIAALVVIVGLWLLCTGFAALSAAFRLREQIPNEWTLAATGILTILAGYALVLPRTHTVTIVGTTIGIYAVLFGAMLIAIGVRLRSWQRGGERHEPAGAAPLTA